MVEPRPGKGEHTRQVILQRAFALAAQGSLAAVSIGRLAEETGLSKSGLFAHFGSKEALDVAIVGWATDQFVREVVAPSLRAPRGEPRVRALIDRWVEWGQRPGGCFFVAAAVELDDQRGPPRDALDQSIRDWLDALATAARIAVDEHHFRADLDPAQFAFEGYGLMLGAHFYLRFLRDPSALVRIRASFDDLIHRARVTDAGKGRGRPAPRP